MRGFPIGVRTVLFRVASVVIAAGLIWLTLRKTNWAAFSAVLQAADYRWLIVLIPVTLLSHLIRAWRWRLLLDTLKSQPGYRLPMGDLFAAVMIGYMVNYALPRAGELVRSAHLARRRQMSASGILGTIISERLIDLVFLAVGLAACALYLGGRTEVILERLTEAGHGMPDAWAGLELSVLLCALVLVPAVCCRLRVIGRIRDRIRPALAAFTEGMATGLRVERPLQLWASTLMIWLLYGVMAYLPLVMFDLASPHGLDYLDGLIIMFVGAVGVLVPTPGGAGSFHYITVVVLMAVFSIASDPATAYAVFVHGYQLILYMATGLLMIIWKGGFSKLQADSN